VRTGEGRWDGLSRLDIVGTAEETFLVDGALGAWTSSTSISAGTAGVASVAGTGGTAPTAAGTSKALSGLAAAPRHIRRSPHRERG
jgi:hypothetical protein